MQHALPVYRLHGIEQRSDHPVEFGLQGRAAERLQPGSEILARLVDEHHIGCAVRLEKIGHLDDCGMLELGELFAFLAKAV